VPSEAVDMGGSPGEEASGASSAKRRQDSEREPCPSVSMLAGSHL
jgi:hypothetical protein